MRIKELLLEDFRGFLGSHRIEFATDDKKNLTLILAENEVGKSTILNAFFWCFYGVLTPDTDQPDRIVHNDSSGKSATISIKIIEDKKEYLFKRNITDKKITFKAWPIDDQGQQGSSVPYPDKLINTLLPQELSDYFLFNGEGLTEIVKDAAKLDRSIQNIQGLTAAAAALERLQIYQKSLELKSNAAENQTTQATNLKARIEKNERKLEEKKSGKGDELEIKSERAKALLEAAEVKWRANSPDKMKLLFDARNNATKNQDTAKINLIAARNSRKNIISDHGLNIIAYAFADDASANLTEARDKGYPSKYHDTLLNDSLLEHVCMACERSFDKGSNEEKLMKQKLEMAIDGDLEERIAKARSVITQTQNSVHLFQERCDEIDELIAKHEETIEELKIIFHDADQDIKKAGRSESELQEIEDEYQDRKVESEYASNQHARFLESLQDLEETIRVDRLTFKRMVPPRVNTEIQNQIDFINETISQLDSLIADTKKSGRDFIFTDMNKSLIKYSKGNHQFRFEKDTYNPVIVGHDGETVVPLSSGGQKLKKNLFFITSLVKHSMLRKNASGDVLIPGTIAPLIVDAPFSDLDETNIKIAARVLLGSSDQLIVMISSSSFNGGFYEIINSSKENKSRLGRVSIIKRKFKGKQGEKSDLEVEAFGQKIKTAIYGSKEETSLVEIIKK